MEKLAPYVFSMEWVKGKSHCIADALSRAPVREPEDDPDIDVKAISTLMQVIAENGDTPSIEIPRTTGFLC